MLSSEIPDRIQLDSNVILICSSSSDERLICNRKLLADKSLYFKKLFESPLESGKSEFELKDTDFEGLKRIVKFCLTSDIELDENNVLETLILATYFVVPTLQIVCENYVLLNTDVKDCVMVFHFAKLHENIKLANQMFAMILKHGNEICKSGDFVSFDLSEMVNFLQSDDLIVENEEMCWNAAKAWFEHDPKLRCENLASILDAIRFPLIETSSLRRIEKEQVPSDTCLHMLAQPIIQAAFEIQNDENRSFEVTHPKYHLRNSGFVTGLIVLNQRAQQRVSDHSDSVGPETDSTDAEDEKDLVGLLDLISTNVKWFSKIPKNISPRGHLCQSSGGDLYISAFQSDNDTSNELVLKYCLATDTWGKFISPDSENFGMAICNKKLLIFHFADSILELPSFPSQVNQRMSSYALNNPSQHEHHQVPFCYFVSSSNVVREDGMYVFLCAPKRILHSEREFDLLPYNQIYHYDPVSTCWTRKSDFPFYAVPYSASSDFCSHTDGLIYCYSRDEKLLEKEGAYRAMLHSYEPRTDSWNTLYRIDRSFNTVPHGIASVGDRLVIKLVKRINFARRAHYPLMPVRFHFCYADSLTDSPADVQLLELDPHAVTIDGKF